MLKRAIKSVQRQTYNNIELIIVDDGSDKETVDYLSNLKAIKFTLLSNKQAKGACHARNLGIAQAKGKFVAFLDDDDEWLPNKISKQIELLNNNKNALGVSCACQFIDDVQLNGQVIQYDLKANFITLLNRNYVGGCSFPLLKLDKTIYFDENLSACQDWDYYLRLLKKNDSFIIVSPEVLLNYSMNTNSITGVSSRRIKGELSFLKKYFWYLRPRHYFNFRYIFIGWFRAFIILILGEKLFVKIRSLIKN